MLQLGCEAFIKIELLRMVGYCSSVLHHRLKIIKLIKLIKFISIETFYLFTRPIRGLRSDLNKYSETRFVFIISFPRSGTTALGTLLEQPGADVNYFGEFFALNYWNREKSKFYPFFLIRYLLGLLIQKTKWRSYLFENLNLSPERALSALVEIPGIHVFKIFPTHLYDSTLESIIEKFKPDILFLRRNHLDRLVSHKKAKTTGLWHGASTGSVEIEIEEKELNDYVTGYENFYRKMNECALSNSLKIMDVEYEKLFEPAIISTVLNFILRDPKKLEKLNIKPRTLKQDSSDASQQSFLRKISNGGVSKKISDFYFPEINRERATKLKKFND